MKLLRYGPAGAEKPGVLDADGAIRDLSGAVADISGDALLPDSIEKLKAIDPASLPKVDGSPRIGACIGNVGKFMCIGLNYSDHAAETGGEVPSEPILFMKANSAIQGPNDDVIIPRDSEQTDWEVELGFVIGKGGKYINEADAMSHVAGYCVVNDVSERNFQIRMEGQWTKGKSCDTFGPLGPWLVTADEVADPQALGLWTEVNGHRYQNGNTNTMVYGVQYLISYLSKFMSLQPGDVVATGTPPGVGMGQKPRVFLKPGDTMRLGVDGMGVQEQKLVADS
ncbi:MAG: fumarylacetoacetate hydrolase family protein [Alphaproteobacteria bacterium]|jgi:2-keto-4-pentenoate hydratase/2-oxohepta-3-ene-1,7-dioic acid hydratase in catechol pathway